MDKGFYEKLNKPVMALAPLSDVTDAAFRRIVAKYGKPDIMYTEFVSCDGLMSVGRDKLMHNLIYSETEHLKTVNRSVYNNTQTAIGKARTIHNLKCKYLA